jgi:hypothetical protein
MIEDPIVDEVRRVRDKLVKRYGGLDGLVKHLQAMDRARLRKAKQCRQRTATKRASTSARAQQRKLAKV